MSRGTYASIDINALHHNLQRVRSYAPHSSVMAMVKSNAYGHGLVPIAKALSDVDAFGVACLEEGLELRAAEITQPITLMGGCFSSEELHTAATHRFDVVVHHEEQLACLERSRLPTPVHVWLKLDTGMHRLGFPLERCSEIHRRLESIEWIHKPIGLMTHLACADDLKNPSTAQQIEQFAAVGKPFAGPRSIANSAGILGWPKTHADWIRPGIMLYGVSPLMDQSGEVFDLRPVMTFYSRLMAVQELRKGDAIGYGANWRCPEDMRVGVVAVGYGDGYPRHARNGTPVLIGNQLCPLVGRVSMDMLTVDLRDHPDARMGDPIVLWGNGLCAEQVASHSDTIAYELLCKITTRVEMRVLDV